MQGGTIHVGQLVLHSVPQPRLDAPEQRYTSEESAAHALRQAEVVAPAVQRQHPQRVVEALEAHTSGDPQPPEERGL